LKFSLDSETRRYELGDRNCRKRSVPPAGNRRIGLRRVYLPGKFFTATCYVLDSTHRKTSVESFFTGHEEGTMSFPPVAACSDTCFVSRTPGPITRTCDVWNGRKKGGRFLKVAQAPSG